MEQQEKKTYFRGMMDKIITVANMEVFPSSKPAPEPPLLEGEATGEPTGEAELQKKPNLIPLVLWIFSAN